MGRFRDHFQRPRCKLGTCGEIVYSGFLKSMPRNCEKTYWELAKSANYSISQPPVLKTHPDQALSGRSSLLWEALVWLRSALHYITENLDSALRRFRLKGEASYILGRRRAYQPVRSGKLQSASNADVQHIRTGTWGPCLAWKGLTSGIGWPGNHWALRCSAAGICRFLSYMACRCF